MSETLTDEQLPDLQFLIEKYDFAESRNRIHKSNLTGREAGMLNVAKAVAEHVAKPLREQLTTTQQDAAQMEQLLHDLAFFQNRIDGRLTPEYECGWNDAVDALTAKARTWFEAQGINADHKYEAIDAAIAREGSE